MSENHFPEAAFAEPAGGTIVDQLVQPVMEQSFIDYSMSVITGRALPDVRDGLKPVHRRILFAMHESGNTHSKAYRKAARTVGDVIGKYHPHGDSSVYDAAVRMAQEFSMSTPLIDGQGNFGSIDGDMPAAMRYTEMRLAKITSEFFSDLEKETVNWKPNYDGSEQEPVVLPMPYPNLLVNGVEGIAVGMASSVPPHNLRAVCETARLLIENPQATDQDVIQPLKGPDFPTAALVHSMDGFAQAVESGRGRVKVRSRWHEEDRGRGAKAIVVDELPYQVNKANLVANIAQLVREKKIDGITDLRDESNKDGVRIYIALRKDESPEAIFAELASKTDLEISFSYNVVVLDGGRPRQIGLREVVLRWIEFRQDVVLARHIFERKQAQNRLHILEAYIKALGLLDQVIELIRQAPTPAQAKQGLVELLGVDEAQAQAVLDLRLQKLTGMEIESIRKDHGDVLAKIASLTEIIDSPTRVREIIHEELGQIADRYGNDRRTEIAAGLSDITREDLIPREDVLIAMTQNGYVKRMPVNALRSQNRGTRGKSAIAVDEGDSLSFLRQAHSHDSLIVFTESGQAHGIRAFQIPEGNLSTKGRHVRNVIDGLDEEIMAVVTLPESDPDVSVLTVTRAGQVKRTDLQSYDNATRRGGIKGVGLDEGDGLVGAFTVRDDDHVLLVSDAGKAIRFKASDVRTMGRTAGGVRGIKLDFRDAVVGAAIVPSGQDSGLDLLCVGEKGVGKRTAIAEFPEQNRAGGGVIAFKASAKTGKLVAAMAVTTEQDLIMLASNGVSNRVAVADIRETGRAASGVILMNLDDGASLVSATTAVREVADPLEEGQSDNT
jgi:DNA gyrase subunit A